MTPSNSQQPSPGQVDPSQRCPCGTGDTYAACCGRFHAGAAAPTAEALMRSRYSANALLSADPEYYRDYLHRTWVAETRPELDQLRAAGPRWTRLVIMSTTAGGPFDSAGTVEFVATYQDGATRGRLQELSRFRREAGTWRYIDGEIGDTGGI